LDLLEKLQIKYPVMPGHVAGHMKKMVEGWKAVPHHQQESVCRMKGGRRKRRKGKGRRKKEKEGKEGRKRERREEVSEEEEGKIYLVLPQGVRSATINSTLLHEHHGFDAEVLAQPKPKKI
jgi:hypothetical protein